MTDQADIGRPLDPVLPVASAPPHANGSAGDLAPPNALRVTPPGVRPADRYASLFEVLVCSGVPTQVLIALLLQGVGWLPYDGAGQLSLRYVATLSLADTLLLIGLAATFLVWRGESPRAVWFGHASLRREAMAGFVLIPAVLLLVAGLGLALRTFAPWLHNVPENPLEALMRGRANLIVFACVVVLAGGVREEVQRAFVLHRFRQHLGGARVGLWVFSMAFGLGHLLQGYDAAILTGVLGLVWGVVYLQRGSIVAPMVSHAAFNLVEVIRQASLP